MTTPQLTRDDILTNYRDRIAAGKRSKLTKLEREALADSFIEMLGYCESEEDCITLCQAELALLEKGYPQKSIASQYLPQWRKAIAAAVEDGRLPRMDLEPNAFGKVYEHWALYHLLYPNETYKAQKTATTTANNTKQDNLQPVRADRFISTARKLLKGESAQEIAAGLLALTGRRFSEIIAFGEFFDTDHPYAIAFKGQLKKGLLERDDAETFLIATLVEKAEVLDALEQLREHPRIQELKGMDPDEINSKFGSSVKHHIRKHFQTTKLVPILPGEKAVSAHNLRGVYGTIAIHFFCPPTQNPHRFIQAHLGHIIGQRELASRKNAGATEHYFHYYPVGAQGQMLGDRGILLKQVGALPSSIEIPAEFESTVEVEPTEDTPVTEPTAKKRRARSSVPADLMDGLKAIASSKFELGNNPNNSDTLTVILDFLRDDKTPTVASSIDSLGTTFQWFTAQVDLWKAEADKLRLERDQALRKLDQSKGDDSELIQELAKLRRENNNLRAELQQFHQLKKVMGMGNPKSNSDSATSEPKRQRLTHTSDAVEQLDRAISLVIEWNNSMDAWEDKWFISVPILQDLLRRSGFSASQPRLKMAMDNRRQEIDNHHHQHKLGRRHNVRHNEPISTVLVLTE